jgi:pSer/pThr/pTyr-binding forkhead associated (FHA) protein
MLSKEHLAIKISGNRVIVTDLGSTNGSYIDGKKIEPRESVVLTKGSKLILGSEEVVYVLE